MTPDIDTVGVIGAGTMGSGIAIAVANAGFTAIVVDAASDALDRSRQFIERNYVELTARGRLDAATGSERSARIRHTAHISEVAGCSFVIEAVFESLELKAAVFRELGAVCDARTILATNTSTLDVDAIARAATGPQRCLGMHFFSPAHIMKLVEIVRGAHTAPSAIEHASALSRVIGKTPVVVANADGFVGNRMLLGYRREAEFLVLAGAPPHTIDAVLEDFGFKLGPFAVADLAGIDIGVRAKHERAERGHAPLFRQTNLPDRLVAAGRLGRKSGSGYYHYPRDAAAEDDDELAAMISAERSRLNVERRRVSRQEIVDRCVLALVNEGARLVETGVAASAEDVDTIWRLGYGFPAARGGPMTYAAALGYERVVAAITEFAADDPEFWSVAPLLRRLAGTR